MTILNLYTLTLWISWDIAGERCVALLDAPGTWDQGPRRGWLQRLMLGAKEFSGPHDVKEPSGPGALVLSFRTLAAIRKHMEV